MAKINLLQSLILSEAGTVCPKNDQLAWRLKHDLATRPPCSHPSVSSSFCFRVDGVIVPQLNIVAVIGFQLQIRQN
jgi:hypothetical protein